MSGSHPAVRFEHLPVVEGPLQDFDRKRPLILADVVAKTHEDFANSPLDLVLGEALYSERLRLKRDRGNLFTFPRKKADQALWGKVQSGLLRPGAVLDRKTLLDLVLTHYAEEIGGRFDRRVYGWATNAVPWTFSWLLNAASVKRFLPWGMTEALQSRLRIVGEIPVLQKLARKGTILLVPTHQSNIDSVLIGYVIYLMSLPPFAYGAGLNLYSNPLFSFFMSRLGAYTVDRQKQNQLYKRVLKNYSTRILREGIHSIFFPGGGRSRTGAIETKLKLGLLGTGLEAQLYNHQQGKPNPNIYVVPMVTSYHFVLEASSLIEQYLSDSGKHRFLFKAEDFLGPTKLLNFFWKLFSSQSGITVRIGKPMDIFGNPVDEEGRSLGPNGTTIDPVRWLTSRGSLISDPQRDHEYTRRLGAKIGEGFLRENTVLTSHLVAFAFFETLRKQYPGLDLYRILRISLAQRSLPYENFLAEAEGFHQRLRELADSGRLYLSEELTTSDTRAWVEDGIRNLGLLHDAAVIKVRDGVIFSEDMNLLYYYRNRLSGYGLEGQRS